MTSIGALAAPREVVVDVPQVRVSASDATRAFQAVLGMGVVPARARLRFGPGRTCEQVARLLDRSVVQAERAGVDVPLLVVVEAVARAADDIVRVRRMGFGIADWVRSPTSRVRIVLGPTLHREPILELSQAATSEVGGRSAEGIAPPDDPRTLAVVEGLSEVIDPDLGVNIVDLGFVRSVALAEGEVTITLTLTSPACPLRANMESQIGNVLRHLGEGSIRVDWQWVPAWRPADVTELGREQLRAIGFSM